MNKASDIPEIHSAANPADLAARGGVERVVYIIEAGAESAKMKPVPGPSLLHAAVDRGHHRKCREAIGFWRARGERPECLLRVGGIVVEGPHPAFFRLTAV